jgi:hypothetical protein
MSYSYIKNVFPDFSSTTNTNIFNNINEKNDKLENEMKGFVKDLLNSSPKEYNANDNLLPSSKFETFKEEQVKDNLRYYNIPLNKSSVEGFEENKQNSIIECEQYVKHILECSKCKGIVMKQLNIDGDKIRNEEMMELFSYIVFGVFILLLIDVLKKE